MKRFLLTEEDLPKLKEDLQLNSIASVARTRGISTCTITRFLLKYDLTAASIKKEYRDRMFKVYVKEGRSLAQIAKLFGMHHGTLKAMYPSGRYARKILPSELEVIKELLQTVSAAEVADKWDIAKVTLERYLRNHGTSASKIKEQYRIDYWEKNKHLPRKAVAHDLGISSSFLSAIIAKHR